MDQLNQAVDAVLADRDSQIPSVDPKVAPLAQIAAQLRDLPGKDFRARLKNDLETRATQGGKAKRQQEKKMSSVKPVREGFHTVTPYLIVQEVEKLIDFVKQAFGAEELFRAVGSAGGYHCEVKLGGSILMMGGGGAWRGTPTPGAIHLYVKDVDQTYQRALEAGASSLMPPTDQEYGDRDAAIRDVTGNQWYIGTHKGASWIPEDVQPVMPYFHPKSAPPLIDFMKRALGAEEIARYTSPEGRVLHAKIRIGDSIVEMGEAHEQWQPMPMTLFLSVEDVDAWYQRAVNAGASSISEPADQPYGDRVAGVKDDFGNVWYLATHIRDA